MLVFLKLGGSLITDKAKPSTARPQIIDRISQEIAVAIHTCPNLRLIVGHGSGSFGHVVAEQYGTRDGVHGPKAWQGFAHVSVAAASLNQIVLDALHAAGVAVWRIQPSASVMCRDGQITEMELRPIRQALAEGLVPLVYGDVALDEIRGGTIISTEEIFLYLAQAIRPARILLAGESDGVRDRNGQIVPRITPATLSSLMDALGGSEQIDVTGGMETKVTTMLTLCQSMPGLKVHIFSGLEPQAIYQGLTADRFETGTCLFDSVRSQDVSGKSYT